jgi:CHAT domain-containing protein/tetratricopeptide (TPR) repeat protein
VLVASGTRTIASKEPAAVLELWEGVEATLHEQGYPTARRLARRAVTERPDSPALLMQYIDTEIGAGGIGVAQRALDSLRTVGLGGQVLLAGDYAIAVELGQSERAVQIFGALERTLRPSEHDSQALDDFWRTLERARLEIGAGLAPGLAHGDSLLASLEHHPLLRRSGFAGTYLSLAVERVRISSLLAHRGLEPALDSMIDLVDTALARGFVGLAARAAFQAARVHVALEQWSRAAERFEQAASLAERIGNVRWQALDANYRGLCLEELSQFREALRLRRRAVQMLERQGGDPTALAHALLGLGWSAWKTVDPQTAESALERALGLFEATGNTWGQTQALNNLALVYHYTDRRDEALQLYEEALRKAEATGNTTQQEMVLNNLGILHQEARRPDLAIAVYQDLLARHRVSGNLRGELMVLNNLGLVTRDLGQLEQAKVLFEQCIDRSSEAEFYDTVPPRINLGQLLMATGEHREALIHLRRALELALRAGDQIQEAEVRIELGRCLDLLGRPEQARPHLVEADSLLAKHRSHRLRIRALNLLARVRLDLESYQDARIAVARAESLSVLLNDPSSLASSRSLASRIQLCAGRSAEARMLARSGLEAWSQARNRSRTGFDERLDLAFYTAATTLLMSVDDLASADVDRTTVLREVFEAVQSFKSRSLLEYVQAGSILPQVPDSLSRMELRTRLLVDRIWKELETPALTQAAFDSLRLALAEAETVHQNRRQLVFTRDRRFERAATGTSLTLQEARATLVTPGTLVLDFLVPEPRPDALECPIALFVLDARGLSVALIEQKETLPREIALLLDVLDMAPSDRADLATDRTLLDMLGRTLLGPVADRLAQCRELIVSPDGVLNRVPFAALRLPPGNTASGSGGYLVERMAVVTTPALAYLNPPDLGSETPADWRCDLAVWSGSSPRTTKPEHDARTLSMSAPPLTPLRYAEAERKALLDRYANARSLTVEPSDDPPAVALAGLFDRSRIVHFIAHGFFDDRRPWRSGLYLDWQAPHGEALRLEITDIYGMDFRSQLVTLSACDMARETSGKAIGWRGFARALFGSGARSVLAPLWAIDDASAPMFMTGFYRHLASGASESEALRQTQLDFLRDDRLQDPFYWAPYVLLGDGRQSIDLTTRPRWTRGSVLLLVSGTILFFVAMLLLVRGRSRPSLRS